MKRYSIFHLPVHAFFSAGFYRDVFARWRGIGAAALLLLLAVCWIPVLVSMQSAFSRFIEEVAPPVVTQVPVITIEDGVLSIDEPQPYTITDPSTDTPLAVIDTTGAIASLDDTKARAVVTATHAIVQKSAYETRTFQFGDIDSFVLDPDRINGWLDTADRFLVPALYPFALAGSYVFRLLQVLVYGAIGLLIAKAFRLPPNYPGLVRLSVAAITPGILIKTGLTTANIELPHAGWIYFGLATGYLLFGVRAAASPACAPPPIPGANVGR